MAGNAFDEQSEFLRSEKDTRPYWETQHRALAMPLIKSGYNDSVSYGVPGIFGGSAWGTLDDILRGRPVAKGEVEAAAGEAAGAAMTGAFAAPRPKGSIGMAGREQPAAPARELDPLGFYSQALETAKTLQPKGTIDQYLGAMRNKGVKQAEIDATNVANAFEAGKPITRDDLVDLLRKNRVTLNENKYAGSQAENRIEIVGRPWTDEEGITSQTVHLNDREYTARYDRDAGNAWAEGPNGEMLTATGRMNNQSFDNAYDAIRQHGSKSSVPDDARGPASWATHSLDETNPTYAERVLHMPPSRRVQEIEARMAENERVIRAINEQAKDLRANPDFAPLRAARSENNALYDELKQIKSQWFRSGHFDEPNIVGHTQSSIGNLPDGRTAQILDQVQSDWGQKLRDGGVRDEKKIAALEKRIAVIEAGEREKALQHKDAIKGLESQFGINLVPDSVWAKLDAGDINGANLIRNYLNKVPLNYEPDAITAFRPIIDSVGKTPQDLQLARAELSTMKAATPGHPLVNTTDQWLNTLLRRSVRNAIDANADTIAIPSGSTVLSYNPGKEHGMNAFYNDVVPKNLANILGKLDRDGLRRRIIEQITTPSGPAGQGFTVFDITPKMREEALKGLPLFSRGIPVPMPVAAPAPYDPTIY